MQKTSNSGGKSIRTTGNGEPKKGDAEAIPTAGGPWQAMPDQFMKLGTANKQPEV